MVRIAVIGSCITRDLWPILGEAPDDLLYISRTSLASLTAPPVEGLALADDPPPPLKRHQHNAVKADLEKTAVAALVAHQPTHILLDFIDERFDLLTTGRSVATDSWELGVSGYRGQPPLAQARRTPRLSTACDLLWRDGLLEFAALLAATRLGQATLILHAAQWAAAYRDEAGEIRPFPDELEIMEGLPASARRHNALLTRYQTEALRRIPGLHVVEASPDLRIGSADHRWGLSPFHYVDDYYAEIRRQLAGFGV